MIKKYSAREETMRYRSRIHAQGRESANCFMTEMLAMLGVTTEVNVALLGVVSMCARPTRYNRRIKPGGTDMAARVVRRLFVVLPRLLRPSATLYGLAGSALCLQRPMSLARPINDTRRLSCVVGATYTVNLPTYRNADRRMTHWVRLYGNGSANASKNKKVMPPIYIRAHLLEPCAAVYKVATRGIIVK